MKLSCLVLGLVYLLSVPSSGRSYETLEDQRSAVDALFKDFDGPDVPGASVMIIRDGKVVYGKAYGRANLEKHIPCTTKTNYRIASMTKQFTAMAVLILAEKKSLSLDDPLTRFFPDFPLYGKQITVRHLLNHTSGLIDYPELISKESTVTLKDRDVLDMVMRQNHTHFAPGSQFRYCNAGYVILGLIVEAVSGRRFNDFLKENIFKPLGMSHTVFYQREDYGDKNRAIGYTKRESGFERTDQSTTSSLLADGSIYSSVEDLYKWDQALYTSRFARKGLTDLAFTAGISIDVGIGYGFGWFIQGDYHGLRKIFHGGTTIGFKSEIDRFPDQRFSVIVLANLNRAPLTDIAGKIADLYLLGSK
jgi:CubicO group peptidase (beta-lactamase class C family)